MPNILIAIFNMSIAGSVVITLALIARFFLRTVSKKYSYMIWGIVCIRLLCPFGLNFQSILNLLQGKEASNIIIRTEYIPQIIGEGFFNSNNTETSIVSLIFTSLFVIWILGFTGMVFYEATSYYNAKKRLATAIKKQENVYETDQISTPFIFGLIQPKIYVPVGITDTEMRYVLCHELIHITRKDYLIKFFGSVVLAFHWFNPFVWLAFKYMSVDMEMSCDEKVVNSLGESVRKEYAEIIFTLSKTTIKITKSMLAFGASDTRKRVHNLLNKKKNTAIRVIATAIICAILIIGLVSNSAVSSIFSITRDGFYTWEFQRLETTDLSNITVDGLHIGSDTSGIHLPTHRVTISIDNENKVRSINVANDSLLLSVNGHTEMILIEDITNLLGNNYLDKSQDREQQLRKRVYYDKETGVIIEIIYANHTRYLAWTILRNSV